MIWIYENSAPILLLDNDLMEGMPILSAHLKEQINGEVMLTFSIPADHPDSDLIKEGQWAIVRDPSSVYRAFVITEEESTHDGDGLVRYFYTEELAINELSDFIIEDKRPQNTSASAALTSLLQGSGWSVGTVGDFGLGSTNFYYEDAITGIRKIIDTWGGEVRFRVTLSEDNQITGRFVDLLPRLGTDTGKRFEYSKDLVSVTRNVDIKTLKTALYGRGKGVEVEGSAEDGDPNYGRRLTFADVVWSVANGDPADKPAGQEWIEDPEALAVWGHLKNDGTKVNRFGVFVDEEETDPVALLQKTWDRLQQVKIPVVSYKMDVIHLERMDSGEYQHEAVRLGDGVVAIDREFRPVIELEARVVEADWDLLDLTNTKIVLGSVIENMADFTKDVQRELDNKVGRNDPISWMEGVIDTSRSEISNRLGYVYIQDPYGLITTNRPLGQIDNPPDQAVSIRGGAIMLADSLNPDGTFNWRTFITGQYVYADLINAGTMLADRIRGGELYLGGIVNGVGQNGRLFLLNSNDDIICQMDAESQGFDKLFVGTISGNNVVTRTTENMTFYIDPVNGSSENDGRSTGQALSSFADVWEKLPKMIEHLVEIKVIGDTPPTWSEEVYMSGYNGDGQIRVDFQNATMNGHFKVAACATGVVIENGNIFHTGTISQGDSAPWACLHVSQCLFVSVINMTLDAKNVAQAAFRCSSGKSFLTDSRVFNGQSYLIWAHDNGELRPVNNVGRGTAAGMYGLFASNNGTIGGYGTAPSGTTSATNYGMSGGGEIRNPTGFTYTTGTQPSQPAQPTLRTWSATAFKSWDTNFGWNRDYPTQGNAGSWGSAGTHRGLYFFDSASIRAALSGKTITKIRVELQRNSNSGYYSSRPVYFWTHNNTGASGGQPALANSAGNLANFNIGEKKWVNLPISFGNALRDNTAKGIAIYASNASQANYVSMQRYAKLEITYQ